jgi:hypothetical protein
MEKICCNSCHQIRHILGYGKTNFKQKKVFISFALVGIFRNLHSPTPEEQAAWRAGWGRAVEGGKRRPETRRRPTKGSP